MRSSSSIAEILACTVRGIIGVKGVVKVFKGGQGLSWRGVDTIDIEGRVLVAVINAEMAVLGVRVPVW